ncbi:hypothetical protein [Larsenimonas suaedae]|uniref:Uncharacterized protein n=1 Tax=Larsenimonas suaedae TaxID=1851019 RepID=A0ABU1GVU6_9GAMM|nr:hypothetical protein [Larsenimonas suaedae]MCM2973267.1 hypothetical protein [Larsenimonas suaedae]MDR5896160.1 hypothetical protein [Larsenimonas suaedae]
MRYHALPQDMLASRVSLTLARYLGYALILALICQLELWTLTVDAMPRFSETSFVEVAQSVALALSVVVLIWARRFPLYRQGVVLMAGWLLASLIREQDFLFDQMMDGLWQVLVAAVALPTLVYTWRQRATLAQECQRFFATQAFGLFMGGFLTTYVFSRLLGRKVVWQAVLGSDYAYRIKSGVEENIELLGYLLMLFACIELALQARRHFQKSLSFEGVTH